MKLFLFLLSALSSTVSASSAGEVQKDLWKNWLSGNVEGFADLFADGAEVFVKYVNPEHAKHHKYPGTHVNGQNGFSIVKLAGAWLDVLEFNKISYREYVGHRAAGANKAVSDIHLEATVKSTGDRFHGELFNDIEINEYGKIIRSGWTYYINKKVRTSNQLLDDVWTAFTTADAALWTSNFADNAVNEVIYPPEIPFTYAGRYVAGQNGFTYEKLLNAWLTEIEFLALTDDVYTDENGAVSDMTMKIRVKSTGDVWDTRLWNQLEVKEGQITKSIWRMYRYKKVEKEL